MAADIRCSTATLASWSGEALAVGLFSGDAGASSRNALGARFGTASTPSWNGDASRPNRANASASTCWGRPPAC